MRRSRMESPQTERLGFEPEPDRDGAPFVVRAGTVVAGGALAAIVSSLPGAFRMGGEGSLLRALEQWAILAAVATPMAALAVAIVRQARIGMRLLVGERIELFFTAALWWAVLELGLLSIVGAVLRKTTHQQALAGVAFAAVAIVSGLFLALFARRTTMMLARGGGTFPKIGLALAGGAAVLTLVLVGLRTSRAEGMHTAAAMVDGITFAFVSLAASARAVARVRPLVMVGVPLSLVVMTIGVVLLRFDPNLAAFLRESAPLHAWGIELVGP